MWWKKTRRSGTRRAFRKLADDALVVVVGDVEMHFLARDEDADQPRDVFDALRGTCRETRCPRAAAS